MNQICRALILGFLAFATGSSLIWYSRNHILTAVEPSAFLQISLIGFCVAYLGIFAIAIVITILARRFIFPQNQDKDGEKIKFFDFAQKNYKNVDFLKCYILPVCLYFAWSGGAKIFAYGVVPSKDFLLHLTHSQKIIFNWVYGTSSDDRLIFWVGLVGIVLTFMAPIRWWRNLWLRVWFKDAWRFLEREEEGWIFYLGPSGVAMDYRWGFLSELSAHQYLEFLKNESDRRRLAASKAQLYRKVRRFFFWRKHVFCLFFARRDDKIFVAEYWIAKENASQEPSIPYVKSCAVIKLSPSTMT